MNKMKCWIDEQTGCKMCEPNCVDEWLQFIWDIGCDYDGYSDANNLKQLIDELVDASIQARECLHKGELFAKEMMTEHNKGSVMRVLMQSPTVDGVHAHWIHHHDNLFPTESTMECSHCHEEETVFILNDNYCPNCGAKMDGGSD